MVEMNEQTKFIFVILQILIVSDKLRDFLLVFVRYKEEKVEVGKYFCLNNTDG